MNFSALVLFTLASFASAASLNKASTTATCGPQVKVCLADFLDAAGSPSYECKEAVDGAKVRVSKDESANGAIICGPGTFHFSPMQCAGDKFEYKKQSTDVTTSSWSGGTNCPGAGQTVTFHTTWLATPWNAEHIMKI